MAGVPLWFTAVLVITAVFIYTLVGGLEATIFTDAVQFVVIVPLLLLSFGIAVFALGGWETAIAPVTETAPELLTLAHGPGIKFGATLVIAVIAAEMFNQANWQRVYACKTDTVMRRSFLGSFLVILPILFLAGLLGILAMHFGFNDDRAFFSLIQELGLPGWVSMTVLVLVLALVMSSLDTLLNGIASVFTTDLLRLFPDMQSTGILRMSRMLTVVVGIPVILNRFPGLQRAVPVPAGGSGLCRSPVSGAVWAIFSPPDGSHGLLERSDRYCGGGTVLPSPGLQPLEQPALCWRSANQLCRPHPGVSAGVSGVDSAQSPAEQNRTL